MPIIGDQIATGTVTGANIADGTIANADINSAASIAESKLADLGKEGAASLAANIKRRGEELAYEVIPAEGITLGTGNEHKIEEASVPDMTVRIQSANCAQVSYGADAARILTGAGPLSVTLSAADATHPRYDLISLKPDGTLRATAGTPAGSPALPALPANDVLLSVVKIAATVTAILNAVIYDHRRRSGRNPDSEEFTGDGTTAGFDIARRIDQPKSVKVYRNGLRIKYGAIASVDNYQVTNGIEKNGSTVTIGVAPTVGEKILVEYS